MPPGVQHVHSAPEPYRHGYEPQPKQEAYAYYNETSEAKQIVQPRAGILGMRRRNFWILAMIALILVGVTVGGSVGGVLAVQNARSKSESAVTPSVYPIPSSFSVQATTPIASPATSASTSASTSLYVPPSAASVLAINIDCPSVLESYNGKSYRCFQNTDINSLGDITGITAYSLQQCVDACSTMNEVEGIAKCQAVALSQALSDEYGHNKGANCWLKNVTEPRAGRPKLTVAVLNV
ncbi:hypothetical protein EK21DRAFT_74698 [Setomelanomma holmii]|uniref:Apple domain-containing protein n=1 Tax=Setomelanomma holmii TaxID=210430 RepID=A0A9P4H398_9PLEO|nr:hypothetical protein EK21DRAFT_74698 [Setomelanomma holmii]